MGESDTGKSWKEMLYEALSDMKGQERELMHRDREVQLLKLQVRFPGTVQVIPVPINAVYKRQFDESRDDVEAACLQQSIERNVNLEEEKNSWRQLHESLNAEFERSKAEVEAVVTAMETFKAEAEHNMQMLTNDVRHFQAAFKKKLQNLMRKVEEKIEDLHGDQIEVVRTFAEEQKIILLTLDTEATLQVIIGANLARLGKVEELCDKTIHEMILVRDPGR